MERKASSLRFTRGRLAALLLAVVLVTIVVFSLTFYHLCLHAKRMEVLTQGDGPLWAFEQGQLDILSQEADGATVYGGSGCRVTVRNGEITAVTDENMGFSKFYEGGVLTSVTFDNPLAEAAALCTPFSVNSYVQYTVRTPEEARTIRARAGPGRDRHSGGARPALLGAGQRLSRCGDMNSAASQKKTQPPAYWRLCSS